MTEEVYCAECKYCSFHLASAGYDFGYHCKNTNHAVKEKSPKTSLYREVVYFVSPLCEKVNKKNNCPYFEKYVKEEVKKISIINQLVNYLRNK